MDNPLKKPAMLKSGDTVAAVSLSWGGAGDEGILWRYWQGKQRLEEVFGLHVVEMPHTLSGTQYVYDRPEDRAKDLMDAFRDSSIKGIISCIGGNESIRILPYIDFNVIGANPKVFTGYSDTTIAHLICQKAGISSFYGPCLLVEFGENIAMHDYTARQFRKVVFEDAPIGEIEPSPEWTSEFLPWEEKNRNTARRMNPGSGYELLQGSGIATGRLTGGCIEVLEFAKGTCLWPAPDFWKGKILFLETSEEKPIPQYVEYWLRNYGAQGILQQVSGIVWGKPYDQLYYDEYKSVILKVLGELGLQQLPVLYNLNFGHTSPICTLPYGALAQIDCERQAFSVLESGVHS